MCKCVFLGWSDTVKKLWNLGIYFLGNLSEKEFELEINVSVLYALLDFVRKCRQ